MTLECFVTVFTKTVSFSPVKTFFFHEVLHIVNIVKERISFLLFYDDPYSEMKWYSIWIPGYCIDSRYLRKMAFHGLGRDELG